MEVLSSRVLVAVSDLARSRAFYEATIGLRVYREYGVGGSVTGVVYFLGGGFLELSTGGGASAADGAAVWLQVPDAFAESARLVAAGVTVCKPVERMPWGLVECWIEDPDGLELRIVEVPEDHPIRRRVDG